MKNFFDNLSVTIKEWFEAFKEVSLKKKLIMLASLILAVILIITGTLIYKSRQKPNANPDEIALSYAQNMSERKYYEAFEYTIIGKDGVDRYLDDNYLSDYTSKTELAEKEQYDIINVCETLASDISVFMSTHGISDYDNFFAAYVQTAENLIKTYLPDTEFSDKLIIECIKYSLNSYSKEYVEQLNEQYKSNYQIELNEPLITKFTDDEVQLYIDNKSDLAKTVFQKSGLNPEKIKAVTKYEYEVYINGTYSSTVKAYLVKVGGFWYVDTTALVY